MLESTIIVLITTSSALAGLLFRYCFLSKCNVVKCGCIEIHRNTNEEQQIQLSSTPQSNRNIV